MAGDKTETKEKKKKTTKTAAKTKTEKTKETAEKAKKVKKTAESEIQEVQVQEVQEVQETPAAEESQEHYMPEPRRSIAFIGSECYPFVKTRRALLDAFDAVAEGGMPVRIDACRPLRVLPRILSDGQVDSVTILNLSSGGTDVFRLRVRRPVGLAADWWLPGREPIHLSGTANGDELVVELPDIPGSQIGTLFF